VVSASGGQTPPSHLQPRLSLLVLCDRTERKTCFTSADRLASLFAAALCGCRSPSAATTPAGRRTSTCGTGGAPFCSLAPCVTSRLAAFPLLWASCFFYNPVMVECLSLNPFESGQSWRWRACTLAVARAPVSRSISPVRHIESLIVWRWRACTLTVARAPVSRSILPVRHIDSLIVWRWRHAFSPRPSFWFSIVGILPF